MLYVDVNIKDIQFDQAELNILNRISKELIIELNNCKYSNINDKMLVINKFLYINDNSSVTNRISFNTYIKHILKSLYDNLDNLETFSIESQMLHINNDFFYVMLYVYLLET